jgi:hypothetical protein
MERVMWILQISSDKKKALFLQRSLHPCNYCPSEFHREAVRGEVGQGDILQNTELELGTQP